MELRRYFDFLNDKLKINKDTIFNAELRSAVFDDSRRQWLLTCRDGTQMFARWFIPAIGFASKKYVPPLKGLDRFKGPLHHTAVSLREIQKSTFLRSH